MASWSSGHGVQAKPSEVETLAGMLFRLEVLSQSEYPATQHGGQAFRPTKPSLDLANVDLSTVLISRCDWSIFSDTPILGGLMSKSQVPSHAIDAKILSFRGQRVILDAHLAEIHYVDGR